MAEVHLLWEQANHEREIAERVGLNSGYRPALMGVFAEPTTPARLAAEHNDTHHYSTRWVSAVPIEES